jgi:hypothetical protein
MAESSGPPSGGLPEAAKPGAIIGAPLPSQEAVYRSLSLAALGGLALGVLYSLMVVSGGLVALFHGQPYLMAVWTVLLPLASCVLCLLAIFRIRASEGVLTGDRLARWGLALSILVGLSYWTYYGVTFFIITRQAEAYGRIFLHELTQRKLETAYRLGLPFSDRQEVEADLRKDLEIRHNLGNEQGGWGMWSRFGHAEMVRLLSQGGPTTDVQTRGTISWEYKEGGYRVRLLFRVKTPLSHFDLVLVVQGTEGRHKEFEGRQWNVVFDESSVKEGSQTLTPRGEKLVKLNAQSSRTLDNWLQNLTSGRRDEAFLWTRPLPDRERLQKKFPADLGAKDPYFLLLNGMTLGLPSSSVFLGRPLLGVSLASNVDLLREWYLPGYREFTQGNLVRAEPQVFWAPSAEMAKAIIGEVKLLFGKAGNDLGRVLNRERTSIPILREDGDHILFGHDIRIRMPGSGFDIEGVILVDAGREDDTSPPAKMRIQALELVRGKTTLELKMFPPPGGKPVPR